jgi:hypothetical protein
MMYYLPNLELSDRWWSYHVIVPWQCLSVFLLLISLSSCSDKPSDKPSTKDSKPQIQVDEQLMKISVDAGLMQVTLSTGTMTQCLLADSLKQVQDGEAKNGHEMARRIVQDMTAEATSLCDLFSHAEREATATFDQIKKEGRLLDEQYFFSIFTSGDSGDGFHKDDIGLFRAVATCKQLEQEAFRQGIPVKHCRKFELRTGSLPPSDSLIR